MNSSKTSTTICSFLEKGLRSDDFDTWADANVNRLAKVYEKCRGTVAYSLVDASHVLFFIKTVYTIADVEDTMDMARQFVRCQFKDSVV